MWDYVFVVTNEDLDSCGEEFFVECNSRAEAYQIAWEVYGEDNVRCEGRISVEEAEEWGLDTY